MQAYAIMEKFLESFEGAVWQVGIGQAGSAEL